MSDSEGEARQAADGEADHGHPVQGESKASQDAPADRKEAMMEVFQANGITEADMNKPERVTHIEVVMDEYCSLKALRYFHNLKSLAFVQQAISKIEGLMDCTQLEVLLLNENCIEKIEGLSTLHRLKKLYLCTNRIKEIGNGLEGLRSLEVLWIAENQLPDLKGLRAAPNLTELNAARNQIVTCVRSFERNLKITTLNLSDNRMCSFREVLDLARLRSLAELNFADPDWGENPICNLCNYQTYILYHLPTLRVHDRLRVRSEDLAAAEVAFSKKKLYYNMRIKLMRRRAADGIRYAEALDKERSATLRAELEVAAKALKRIDAFFQAAQENPADVLPPESDASSFQDRREVERRVQECQADVADAAVVWEALHQKVQADSQAFIRSLELEMQSGGNVRFELGVPERDAWARQIQDLIRARFRNDEFAKYGIADIRVHSVTQVHNRSLRLRFEELMDSLDMDAQQQLDFLFYVPDPRNPAGSDVRAVAQRGMVSGLLDDEDAKGRKGEVAPVLLTNSLSAIEVPRLELRSATAHGQAALRAMRRAGRRGVRGGGLDASLQDAKWPVACGGKLLVCSAHLPDPQPDNPPQFDMVSLRSQGGLQRLYAKEPVDRRFSDRQGAAAGAASGGAVGSRAAPCPEVSKARCCFRVKHEDPKQKVWAITQPDLVLPEYVVEFDYIYTQQPVQSHIQDRLAEHGPLGGVFREFALYAKLGQQQAQEPQESPFDLPDLPAVERLDPLGLQDPDNRIMSCPGPSVFTDLVVLNLHGRGLSRIDPSTLGPLTSLKTLLLSFNIIESLSCVQSCPSLTHLDASFNLLHSISALGGLPELRILDLSWNGLLSLDLVDILERDIPQLEELELTGNIMTKLDRYRETAVARLTKLRLMDGKDVTPKEMLDGQACVQEVTLSDPLLMERAYTSLAFQGLGKATARRANGSAPPCEWDPDCHCLASLVGGSLAGDGDSRVTRTNWKEYVEYVDLADIGLRGVQQLGGLPNLRKLGLGGNGLGDLRTLPGLPQLEELGVERNGLTSLKGAAEMQELRRLDAGGNQIADVLDLQRLPKLSQLSLEDNYIDSLDSFASMNGLMELYLSNNLIEELRSVLLLKHLPKLIVLDLSGNELCGSADYRLYTIFHLRRLKVLDGIPVLPGELHEAEDRFSGRITMELLEDKLGPTPSCYNNRTVDMANQGLKELGQLLNDEMFPSLRELSLDGNPVADIKSLGPLSKLLVLHLNRTKIDLDKGMLGDGDGSGGISALPHLQVLEMGQSGIQDMSHLERFPLQGLRILHLPGNEITKVDGLANLEQLRELVLDRNKIKQVEEGAFHGLVSLRELRMDDNGLKSLTNFGPLPRLRALRLSMNRIAELGELEKLRSIRGHVVLVHLSQNPVARKPLYRSHVIHAMGSIRAIDGKEVTGDELEKVEQVLQIADPKNGGPGAGIYVFTEQAAPASMFAQPTSVNALMGRDDGPRGQPVGGGAGRAEDYRRPSGVESRQAPTQSHIVMSGLGMDEAEGRGNRRGPATHDGDRSAANGGPAAKKQPRDSSLPRRQSTGYELRTAVAPPASGR